VVTRDFENEEGGKIMSQSNVRRIAVSPEYRSLPLSFVYFPCGCPDSSLPGDQAVARMGRTNRLTLAVLFLGLITLYGCKELGPQDTQSLLFPKFRRAEVFGFLAGFGTTFAALRDA
jgi:hypothetical protein